MPACFAFVPLLLLSTSPASGYSVAAADKRITVKNSEELSAALAKAKPGHTIELEAGSYRGGLYFNEMRGRKNKPITIRAKDPEKIPRFEGGGRTAMQLSDCSYLVVKGLHVTGYAQNGINVDDGGSFETPSKGMVFEDLTIENTGPKGNHDALKLSGLDDFVVRDCKFEGWGGSGIDMVGCHDGVVERCRFAGKKGFSQSNAIQMKGGTRGVLVHRCFFANVGHRSINLGGGTGLQFFRPKVDDYEAKDIEVAGNRFVGSMAAIAWVSASGGHVHHNTIYLPEKWVGRILQEASDERFKPCHGGVFDHNLIVFDKRVRTFVNVGPNTDPESFTFEANAWFQIDGNTKPKLPVRESDGIYRRDPELKDAGTATMAIGSKDRRLRRIGADAYERMHEKRR
jgi:hypothetical protein